MAISTYKSFLMKKGSGSTYEKMIDIKTVPSVVPQKDGLETTTMSDPIQTFIDGIQQVDAAGFPFLCNFDAAKFQEIKAMEGTEADFSVWFGGTEENGVVTPTGTDGKFDFKGYPSVSLNEKGVNEVHEMTVSIRPTTGVTFSVAAG